MSERNFIGKQLINIKDRISGKAGFPLSVQRKTTELVKEEVKEVPSAPIFDKEFIKAIHSQKEDYLKTKNVVTKVLGDTFTGLEKEIAMMEQKKKIYSDSADSVKKLLEEISRIEESKWSSDDFSLELSEAGRVVERARLENIILNEKLNLRKMEESSGEVKGGFSVLDIVSLSFSQVFKLGFCFSLPLMIGVVVAALIIAITVLVSMGTI